MLSRFASMSFGDGSRKLLIFLLTFRVSTTLQGFTLAILINYIYRRYNDCNLLRNIDQNP